MRKTTQYHYSGVQPHSACRIIYVQYMSLTLSMIECWRRWLRREGIDQEETSSSMALVVVQLRST